MPGRRRSPERRGLSSVTDERGTGTPRGETTEEAQAVVYGDRLLALAASGVPVERAADQLGLSPMSARRYFKAAVQRTANLDAETKREWIAVHMETIRLVIAAHMPLALGRAATDQRPAVKASQGSAQVVLAALKQRAELIGIDAAIQVDISNQAVEDAVADIMEIVDNLAPIELPALPPTRALLPAREDPAG